MTTIEKIHAEIDSARDRLLTEALNILSNTDDSNISMSDLLCSFGFYNTPIAKSGQETKKMLVKYNDLVERIKFYQDTYPSLRFITQEEFDRICIKYKLEYHLIEKYTKDIPEKRLKDLEKACESPFIHHETRMDLLYIAAPKSHFKLRWIDRIVLIFSRPSEIKDPIVFRYVRGGIEVLTKWGADGEDSKLVLPKTN